MYNIFQFCSSSSSFNRRRLRLRFCSSSATIAFAFSSTSRSYYLGSSCNRSNLSFLIRDSMILSFRVRPPNFPSLPPSPGTASYSGTYLIFGSTISCLRYSYFIYFLRSLLLVVLSMVTSVVISS